MKRSALVRALPVLGFLLAAPLSAMAATEGEALATKVLAIFKSKCADCHFPTAAKVSGNLGFLNDLASVAADSGLINRDLPAESGLYKQIVDDDMPKRTDAEKAANKPAIPLTKEQKATILEWIKKGAPDVAPAGGTRPFVSEEDIFKAVLADLFSLPQDQRKLTRYLSLAQSHNSKDSDDDLAVYRRGVRKLLNSLTWRPRVLTFPEVGPQKTLVRINLRDLVWDAPLWENFVKHYPYGIDYSTDEARTLKSISGSELPILRADWFAFAATRPPLYHTILRLPKSAATLETDLLGINVTDAIKRGEALRAGFDRSGISRQNRMVERHEIGKFPGAYWKSYDFKTNTGRGQLRKFPLGPDSLGGRYAFEHDGGEMIFNLPNGFQAYLLADAKDVRLDIPAPNEIVFDANNPDGARIYNGISCMKCHVAGMKPARDQIRGAAENESSRYSASELELIRSLYRPNEEFQAKLNEDRDRFLAAMKQAGAEGANDLEPIYHLYRRFERPIGLDQAASEVGLRFRDFEERVVKSPELRGFYRQLKEGGVPRENFIEIFHGVVANLGLGEHRQFSSLAGGEVQLTNTVNRTTDSQKKGQADGEKVTVTHENTAATESARKAARTKEVAAMIGGRTYYPVEKTAERTESLTFSSDLKEVVHNSRNGNFRTRSVGYVSDVFGRRESIQIRFETEYRSLQLPSGLLGPDEKSISLICNFQIQSGGEKLDFSFEMFRRHDRDTDFSILGEWRRR
jgi:hypothetical protein